MSQGIVSNGSAPNCSQVHSCCSATMPSIRSRQVSVGTSGVGPAVSTGKPDSAYWPGGSRAASSADVRRRPVNPRDTNALIWAPRTILTDTWRSRTVLAPLCAAVSPTCSARDGDRCERARDGRDARGPALKKGLGGLHLERAGKEEALATVALLVLQDRELLLELDALGERFDRERLAQLHQRVHERLALAILGQPGDERAVDLQRVDLETLQVRQR